MNMTLSFNKTFQESLNLKIYTKKIKKSSNKLVISPKNMKKHSEASIQLLRDLKRKRNNTMSSKLDFKKYKINSNRKQMKALIKRKSLKSLQFYIKKTKHLSTNIERKLMNKSKRSSNLTKR